MTLVQCYEKLEGNYDEMSARFKSDEKIKKFLKMFLNSDCFSSIENAIKNGNYIDAFRASHTLKGVCLNLCLDKLQISSSALTEALRGGKENPQIFSLFEKLCKDYEQTFSAISEFMEQE